MKILIVGSDLNSLLLAKYIKTQNAEHDIYVTTTDVSAPEIYTGIRIRENDVNSIVDFVKYNGIEFTIAMSPMAIINGIADEFKKEEFMIFAPFSEAARITYFNSIAKKVLYKLKIPTPKFGIFDRENLAVDYIRRSSFPIVVENDFTLMERESNIYPCFSKAKQGIQKIFENGNQKIVIENYIDEAPLYVYFITDGYNALPLISLERASGEKYTTITAPSQKVPDEIYGRLLQGVIYPILDDITKYTDNYVGIIGLKIKLYKGHFFVHEIYNGFQHYDFQALLSLLDEDILRLFYDVTNGCLGDEYNYINLRNNYSYTVAINKSEINRIEDFEEDFIESFDETKYIVSATGATINSVQEQLCDYIETVTNRDIYEQIVTQIKAKELVY